MTATVRTRLPRPARWEWVETSSPWSAAAIVVVAWGLMALNRFGGLTFAAPRSFTRLVLVGVWSWLALAVAIWIVASMLTPESPRRFSTRTLRLTVAVTGWAHTPVIVLAIVILVAAGAMQLLGPGTFVAVVVFAGIVPVALVTGVQHVFGGSLVRAALAVLPVYALWLLTAVRHVLGQVSHLL